jgi:predicted GNAT family N-acyltransferase
VTSARPDWRAGLVLGAETRELRRTVLRPMVPRDQPIPGDDLPDALHLAAFTEDGQIASTCFIYPAECPFRQARSAWQLRQMATDPALRGTGAGAEVIEAVLAELRSRGADLVWCYAREVASGFYRRLGFHTDGEVFTDEQHVIPHLRMYRAV